MKLIDLMDRCFDRLTVIRRANNSKKGTACWLCLCTCGNLRIVQGEHLLSKHTKSCGCLRLEKGIHNLKHGMSKTAVYRTWSGMLSRCYNKNEKPYVNYGGRGINVCDRWRHNFENFYADMGNVPKGLTLERINNNKGYSKHNCVWASRTDQSRNKRVRRDNPSGISGVAWVEGPQKWRVTIRADYKQYHLGYFKDKKDAKKAREAGELKYWG